jgi:hypothetical protein
MLLIPEDLWIVTGTDIRDMWLDRNDLHELFDDLLEKDDPDGYNKCLIRGILWFNGRPQKTYFNQVNFPDDGLLLNIGMLEVLKTVERYHAANYMTASGGGVNVPINERYGPIGQIRRELQAEVQERTHEWKVHLNYEEAWGGFNDFGVRGEYGAYGYPYFVQ